MRGIRKTFGATTALAGVDLAVQPGEVLGLVGENGAGKSTLMKILAGALRPDAGVMELDGIPYAPRNAAEGRRSGVAMIYQELSLAPHLSVEENIVLGMEPATRGWIRRATVRSLASEALARLNHTDISPDSQVSSLPLPTRQIVEIARALAIGSRVLVLDEPTSSLSRDDILHLFQVIRTLKAEGHAIVYISHFLEELREITDRFVVLRDGNTVGTGSTRETGVDAIVTMMLGRRIDQLYPRTPRTRGEPLLEINELGGDPKPVSATMTVHRGEILGIAGLLGAGRTELLRLIFGLDPVVRGTIRVGAVAGPASPVRRWAESVGILSEDRGGEGLALTMSIADNILMRLGPRDARHGWVRPRLLRERGEAWISRVGIRCRSTAQPVGSLSGGNQQKVAVARLLHEDVDLLLLDEPTRGIDVASKAQIYQMIDTLAAGDPAAVTRPRGVVMVSSYLPELLGMCDQIAVMHRGVLRPPRPASSFTEHSLLVETTGQAGQA